ncbi:hypothetical protein [Caldanaerobius polysaccharolyticus]|uniref:hypothetical protein n=1 Tax=Caldanaerobius polysaccharolyticus TaxID=44256 RepID=UPI00047B82FD|nr:hypothetical protein [Caldanaerobius polysaccharolyticus]
MIKIEFGEDRTCIEYDNNDNTSDELIEGFYGLAKELLKLSGEYKPKMVIYLKSIVDTAMNYLEEFDIGEDL